MNKKTLSIVVVSYNTKKLLADCLDSLDRAKSEVDFDVIVSDNGSADGSIEMVKKNYRWVELIENGKNLGFAKANNVTKDKCKGKYILFLNSDTVVHENALKETVKYLDDNKDVGSITCKLVLQNGELDKDTRRSFPTPWVSFTHLVLPLDKVFPQSKLFAKYWYSYVSDNEVLEVDVIQGAFHMTRRKILDQVGWFDEDYFLDGEDIDLCWRIKTKGWKIVYYPKVWVTHVKKASKNKPSKENRRIFATAGVGAMEIFYKKRISQNYPFFVDCLVIAGIRMIKYLRLAKLAFS